MSAQSREELGGVCSVWRGARRCLLSLERISLELIGRRWPLEYRMSPEKRLRWMK